MNFAQVVADVQINPIEGVKGKSKESEKAKESGGSNIRETKDFLPLLKQATLEEKPPMQPDDYVRVSSIGWMCERQEVLCAVHDVTRVEKTKRTIELIYGFGSKIHELFQDNVFGPERMLVGEWVCRECGHKKVGTMPYECEGCKKSDKEEPGLFFFEEIVLLDKETNIGGHPDGIILVEGEEYLLEIKSIRGDLFMKLKEPYEEAIEQANTYAGLMGKKRIKWLYVNKNARPQESDFFREFTGDFNPDLYKATQEKVRLLRQNLRDKTVPERTMCMTPTSWKAKACKVKKQCFADCKK